MKADKYLFQRGYRLNRNYTTNTIVFYLTMMTAVPAYYLVLEKADMALTVLLWRGMEISYLDLGQASEALGAESVSGSHLCEGDDRARLTLHQKCSSEGAAFKLPALVSNR